MAVSVNLYAEECPNNEIWYTSTDGKVVTPFSTSGFGANILSNTYSRAFNNHNWQALYVPFNIDVEDLLDNFDSKGKSMNDDYTPWYKH